MSFQKIDAGHKLINQMQELMEELIKNGDEEMPNDTNVVLLVSHKDLIKSTQFLTTCAAVGKSSPYQNTAMIKILSEQIVHFADRVLQ